jgi:hypothetical protein
MAFLRSLLSLTVCKEKKFSKKDEKILAIKMGLLYTTEAVCFRDEAVSCRHGHGG